MKFLYGLWHNISDFVYLATHRCAEDQVACRGSSPVSMCIAEEYICDGEDNCGNGWDEDPGMCG